MSTHHPGSSGGSDANVAETMHSYAIVAEEVTRVETGAYHRPLDLLKQEIVVEGQLEDGEENMNYVYSENECGEAEYAEEADAGEDGENVETYYYTEDGDIVTSKGEIAGYIEKDTLTHLDSQDDELSDGEMLEVAYRCSVCSDSFFSYADLRMHSMEHHTHAIFSCEKCGKMFRGHGNYWRHIKTHSDDPKYKFPCQICHKVFSQKANMMKHLNIHLGVKNFQCEVCLKAFSQKANLNKHMLVHSGTLLFECHVCGKRFSQKANLKKHNQIHTGEYSYECEICQKKFIQKINCQKHMKTHREMYIQTQDVVVESS